MINNGKISKCPSAEDLTSILIDNEGGSDEIHSMQDHVRSCAKCSSLMHEYNRTGELVKKRQAERVHLSPAFTINVMDGIYDPGYEHILEDIIGLSKKVVTACAMFVVLLLAIMVFPEDGSFDVFMLDEFTIINGAESEVLEKDEITYDDVVSFALTQR